MKKFDMCLAYGFYTDCFLVQERFASNNALCLSVWNEEDGPICTVNVNTDGVPDGAIAVKPGVRTKVWRKPCSPSA